MLQDTLVRSCVPMKNAVKLLCTHPGPPGLADAEPDSPKFGWTRAYLFVLRRDPLSASASARSFSKQPAWLLIFINNTDPGHKRSSLSRGSRISKCTMSRGCGWNSDLPHFMRIYRRTRHTPYFPAKGRVDRNPSFEQNKTKSK